MGSVDIPTSHGRLEGIVWEVEAPKGVAVVCHPHPLHGGTMHNHVAYRLADAFRRASIVALRFNFRGVGASTGTHDEGRGEIEDARSALDFLSPYAPGMPRYLAGFSFGSIVALRLASADQRVQGALAAGVPVLLSDVGFIEGLGKPVAFVHADRDEYGPLEQIQSLADSAGRARRLFVVTESDHLCSGRLQELETEATKAVSWLIDQVEENRKPSGR